MFNREKRKQRIWEAVNMIKPTSKAELKRTCLYMSNLDVDKAEKMYRFLIDGLENIPDVEPTSKPFIQNFGEQASGVMGWFRENQDMISQGVDMIREIISKRKGVPTAPVNPLPPING